jgi:hypothetical protein
VVRASGRVWDQFEPIGPIQKVRDNLYMIGAGGNTVFVTRTGIVLVVPSS